MRIAHFAFLAFMTSGAGHAANVPSPAQLKAEIAHNGARAVAARLFNENRWDAVSDQIAGGSQPWLDLVPALASGTDGGPSEDLGIDLALALPKRPDAVLRIIDEKTFTDGGIIGIGRVCGVPFVEETEPKGYREKAIWAVTAVSDPQLARKRRECLVVLKNTPGKPAKPH